MWDWLNYIDGLLLLIAGSSILAVWQGGSVEKLGGLANLAAALAWLAAQLVLQHEARAVAALVIDGLLAFAFLFLLFVRMSPWLGCALLLQAAQFGLHSYYFVMEREQDYLFAVVSNLVSYGVLTCIAAGTLAAWTARRRARTVTSSAA